MDPYLKFPIGNLAVITFTVFIEYRTINRVGYLVLK